MTFLALYSRYLNSVLKGDMSLSAVVPVLLWRLPDFLVQGLPMGLLAAILICLARMRSDGELTVMAACGIGRLRLFIWMQVLALPIALLVAVTSLGISPWALGKVDQILSSPAGLEWVKELGNGRFYSDRAGRTIHAARLQAFEKNAILEDIFISEPVVNGLEQEQILLSKRADMHIEPDGRIHLGLQSGEIYHQNLDTGLLHVSRFGLLSRSLEDALVQERRRMGVRGLSIPELEGIEPDIGLAELYWRWSVPMMIPIIVLLACSLSGGIVPTRQPKLVALVPAFLIYFSYLTLISHMRENLDGQLLRYMPLFWPAHLAVVLLSLIFWSNSLNRLFSTLWTGLALILPRRLSGSG